MKSSGHVCIVEECFTHVKGRHQARLDRCKDDLFVCAEGVMSKSKRGPVPKDSLENNRSVAAQSLISVLQRGSILTNCLVNDRFVAAKRLHNLSQRQSILLDRFRGGLLGGAVYICILCKQTWIERRS